MKCVKNKLCTAMTETTLNACMAVGLEKRSLNNLNVVAKLYFTIRKNIME